MTTKEILIAARAKLAQGWTQGWYAKNKQGQHLSVHSPDATCWCSIGALIAVSGPTDDFSACERLLNEVVSDNGIVTFNDRPWRTQAEVLAAFDKAIEASR